MAAEQFVMLLMLGLGSVVWCQPTTGKCNDGQASNVDEWQLQQTVTQIQSHLTSMAERLSMLEFQHQAMQAVMENMSKKMSQLIGLQSIL